MKGNPALQLRTKILILCISCTLAALLLQTLFFEYSASSIVYQQERDASRNALQNMQNELYAWIKSYENDLIKVYNQTELMRDLGNSTPLDALREKYGRVAYEMALALFDTTQNVNALYLYDENNRLISNYRSANTPRFSYAEDIFQNPRTNNTAAVTRYLKSDSRVMLVSSFFNESRGKDVVRFVLKIYTNNVTKRIGYIVCDVDTNSFTRIMRKYAYSDRQMLWLQPSGDRPAVQYGELTGKPKGYFNSIIAKVEAGVRPEAETRSTNDSVFFGIPQQKYSLTAFSLTPQYLLQESQWVLRRNMLIIALIVVMVAVVSATLMTRSLTTPLARIVKSLREIKNGNTELRLTGLKSDEIGSLGMTINEMLDRIQALIAEEYKVTLLLKQAEYRALQAQVNPHFLYNSLDTMSSIAASQQCSIVSSLCLALSNIFRYSIDMKDPLSPVRNEIVHLKNYAYIMNTRMQNSVELDIRIDQNLLDEKVPRLSLQPVVENAFIHGLKNQRGAKRILIEGTLRDNDVVLSVTDNGIGMDSDEINRKLQEESPETFDSGTSIGLGNINARIRLLCGKGYGVSVSSILGKGSTVTLVVPRMPAETMQP